MSPFQPKLNPDALLIGVAEVLRVADPGRPEQVAQSAFDARREVVAGMPTARVACQRFGLAWEHLKEIALLPPERRSRALGAANRRSEAAPTPAAVTHGLRVAAKHLGQQTLRPHEYAAVQEELERRRQRAWRHGSADGPIPTLNQIVRLFEWDAALATAGLNPLPAATSRSGEAPAVVAAAFAEAFGCLPSRSQVEVWARQSGVPLAKFSKPWKQMVVELLAQREADGLPALDRCLRSLATDPALGAPPTPGGGERRRKRWSEQAVVEGLALALDELAPGERLTVRKLAAIARGRPEIPNQAVISRQGLGLEDVKQKAEALRDARGSTSKVTCP